MNLLLSTVMLYFDVLFTLKMLFATILLVSRMECRRSAIGGMESHDLVVRL
jgi:hypothetical protein